MKKLSIAKNTFISFVICTFIFTPLIVLVINRYYDADQIYIPQAWVEEKRITVSLESHKLEQTFVAADDNLAGFDMVFLEVGGSKEDVIKLELLEQEGSSQARTYFVRSGEMQGDTRPAKIRFEPILESKGKEYSIVLTRINDQKDVGVLASQYDTYNKGELSVDGVEQDGDMSFVPVYRSSSLGDFLRVLFKRITSSKPLIFGGNVGWILFSLLLFFTSFSIIFLFISDVNPSRADKTDPK